MERYVVKRSEGTPKTNWMQNVKQWLLKKILKVYGVYVVYPMGTPLVATVVNYSRRSKRKTRLI